MAAFHTTDAAYETKKRWWLFSTPRHQADITISPAPGNRMRTSTMVRSRVVPVNPGAMASMSSGVATTPTSTIRLTASASSDATAPATRSASDRSPRATSEAYTGMNEAESAPSPNRLFRKFGILKAAMKASAGAVRPK
jgi:hypothetical protein